MSKRSKNRIRNESRGLRIFFTLVILVSILISVYPFVYMLILSFMDTTSMSLSFEKIANASYTLNNYRKVLFEMNFLRYFKNSVIVTLYAVTVNCLSSAMTAYAFAKKRFRGKNLMFLIYMATMMIPGQVTLIPCFIILNKLHMLNTYSAIALPSYTAFGVLLMHQFMEALPNDLLEAADIDGCGEFRKFTRIVLPLIKPVMVSLAIFVFIGVWGALVLPMIVTTKSEMTTLTMAIATTTRPTNMATPYGLVMAGSVVAFLPPFIMYLFLQKQFVEGIALSGTKL